MHPNFHQFLYDFFIAGMDLDHIASKYESSWYEVAEVVDSEPARRHMRAAIRAARLRDIAQNLATRRFAIHTLATVIQDRSQTAAGHEGRRRAAAAILSGTAPRRSGARPKAVPPVAPPPPEKQPARPEPTNAAADNSTTKPAINAPNPLRAEHKVSTDSARTAAGSSALQSRDGSRPSSSPVSSLPSAPVSSPIGHPAQPAATRVENSS